MRRLAIYDLDDTLLCGDSEFHWAKFTVSKGFIEEEVYLKKIKGFEIDYRSGTSILMNIAHFFYTLLLEWISTIWMN